MKKAVRLGFLLVALGFGAWVVASQWDAVVAGFAMLTWPMLAGSLVSVVVALLAAMMTWRTLLADLGSPLPLRPAAKVFFVGQLGKYIPGAVWPVLAQMEMGKDLGVPRPRSATAFFLMMPIQLATGLLVTLVTLGWDRFGWALLFIPVLLVLLEPKVINALIGFGLRRLRREPLERPLSRRGMLTALAWALAGWGAYGVHLFLLTADMGLGRAAVRHRRVRADVVPGHHDLRRARGGGGARGGHGGGAVACPRPRLGDRPRAVLPHGDHPGRPHLRRRGGSRRESHSGP
ncbi:lysylphosphatidylglycerol synthase domain-containing protein [Nonomuraea dietziae]|uniref:lysylphosphatidylglycerol synthase domain-containing protein n=1 Tax=Nonomuraea dietziae TaxID=65515 RepID=UPI00361C07C8